MGRKRNVLIRDFFSESESGAKCKTCGDVLNNNVTNLKRHIQSKHPEIMRDYEKKAT